ncbi:MAG: hypothetical protein E7637_08170 [Ruminococcaceae bacterium]|nr:hypothetical protein [Oscillospiraceae bacterium]
MFLQAKPIFPRGKSEALNQFAAFHCHLPTIKGAQLYVTAAGFYRVFVNGAFVAFGPARTALHYARVDVIELDGYHRDGGNEILVEVVGYACRSLSTVRQPSYLCAEVRTECEVLACTGRDFTATQPGTKLQNVMRYSVQRHFSEVWDLREDALATTEKEVEIEVLPLHLTYIPRTAPYPYYEDVVYTESCSRGTLCKDTEKPPKGKIYSFVPSEYWGRIEDDDILYHPYHWVYEQAQTKTGSGEALPLTLKETEYAIFDLSQIETGFLCIDATAQAESDLIVGFSEDGTPDRFEYTDISGYQAIEYLLPADRRTSVMSFEPYVCRWLIVCAKKGTVTLNKLGIKVFQNDVSKIEIPSTLSPELRSIYRAAIRTFAHNAVDVFSDCPSRERAGWLCDSYFTAKTEYELFGKVPVEDAFLENYRLYEGNGDLPEGMIPMCFPADVPDAGRGDYIPQWSMWFLIELEEYLNRRNPSIDRELFRARVDGLLAFYAKYENGDGLLERLPSWNFVEWSVANKWTLDVNYPTNFLYAQVLESVYRIYGDEKLLRKAQAVRRETIAQSFNGRVFLDHAVRDENGTLCRLDDCSEAGQYYAILFGGFDLNDKKYAELKHLVTKVFTPARTEYPEIHPVNAFIGAYLRLETLVKLEEYETLLSDIVGFFGHMEEATGTLWEYRERHGSRDHGFASYALVAIRKALNLS